VVQGFTVTGVVNGRAGIYFASCEKVTIRDCIIRDMNGLPATSGLTAGLSDIDVIDCEFRNLIGSPGGIGQTEAHLLVDNCTFTNCQEAIWGLGLFQGVGPQAVIRNSLFFGNSGSAGGAINIRDYGGGVTIANCRFEGNVAVSSGGAVSIGGAQPWTIQDCTFWGNRSTSGGAGGGAVHVAALTSGTLTGCTFEGNGAPTVLGGSSVIFTSGVPVSLTNNIFSGSIGFQAVRTTGAAQTISRSCNVYWNNAGGNTVGFTLGATDRVVDPEYCDAPSGDLTLYETSPCLPANSAGCGLIGAHDQGCGSVSVEATSWGRVKEGYR
jgi:hypothetical protein